MFLLDNVPFVIIIIFIPLNSTRIKVVKIIIISIMVTVQPDTSYHGDCCQCLLFPNHTSFYLYALLNSLQVKKKLTNVLPRKIHILILFVSLNTSIVKMHLQ